jgi:hypothetical protein
MPIDPAIQKAMLDWTLGAAGATRPGGRWISFVTSSPTSQSTFEGMFTPRQTVTFAAANSPQMSVTNLNALTLATAQSTMTAIGWNLWESQVGGQRLAYGTATAAIGCKALDNISIAAGALKIVLS